MNQMKGKIILLNLPNVVTTRASKGPGTAGKALERLDLTSKLAKQWSQPGLAKL
jgi:hypothetical protein